ncbi:MAG: DedA family protein [Burkholderiales bacterium]|nr:DedA family protein [Burkholderiales bacterium]
MSLAQLIADYGYWVVLAGTLLEGESVLVLAGFAAHRGLLDLSTVIAVAVMGGFLGDQVFFLAGRRYGERLLARFPAQAAPAARAKELLARHHIPVILGVRFLYGLRIVLPFTIGMSGIPVLRFQILNLIGAAIWAGCGAALGYLLGDAVERVLGRLEQYEAILFAVIAAAALAYWWFSRRRAAGRGVGR